MTLRLGFSVSPPVSWLRLIDTRQIIFPGSDERSADILLPFWTHGRDTAVDVTVVNALQGGMVTKVAADGGFAVEAAHSKKVKKYRERCKRKGMVFLPLAVDTLGGWHEEALEVISKLGPQLARVVGRDEGETVQHLRQRLGVVLLRDNVGLLGSRAPEAAPAQVTGSL